MALRRGLPLARGSLVSAPGRRLVPFSRRDPRYVRDLWIGDPHDPLADDRLNHAGPDRSDSGLASDP